MKRAFFLLMVMVWAAAAYALPSTVEDGVQLRTGPSFADDVKLDLPKDYPLKIIERNAGWCLVADWLNCQGWVEEKSITGESTGVVRKSNISLRSGPGTRFTKLSKLYQGMTVKILGSKGVWFKVLVIDGPSPIEGWLHSRYLWG